MNELTAYQLMRITLLLEPELKNKTSEGRHKALDRAYRFWLEAVEYLRTAKGGTIEIENKK